MSVNRLDRKPKVNLFQYLETSSNKIKERFLPVNMTLKLSNTQACDTDDKVCVIELSTENEFQFNISTANLSHTYTNDIMCTYGGLAVYDRKSVFPNAITTYCLSRSNDYEHRPIYSNSSRILLVIYTNIQNMEISTCWSFSGLDIPIQGNQCVVVQFTAVLDLFFYKLFAFVVPKREIL